MPSRYYCLGIVLAGAICHAAHAQVRFRVSPSVQVNLEQATAASRTSRSTSRQFVAIPGTDSAYSIAQAREVRVDHRRDYRAARGFGAEFLAEWPVADRWFVSFGVGVAAEFVAVRESSALSFGSPIGRADTVVVARNPGGSGGGLGCFTIDGTDGAPFDPDAYAPLRHVGLELPLRAGYIVLPGRVLVEGGSALRTPVYSSYERTSSVLLYDDDPRVPSGECAFLFERRVVTTGEQTRPLQVGLSAAAEVEVLPRLSLRASVAQSLTPRTQNSIGGLRPDQLEELQYRPLRLGLGLSYRVGGGGPARQGAGRRD